MGRDLLDYEPVCFSDDVPQVGCDALRSMVARGQATTEEDERLKVLERENRELPRANENLTSPSALAAELDRRPTR